ncbi:MAG: hypothetical protein NTZ17_05220 [Phycisphaerae bacterium]|nr:hypothetical protein [Phycisphaerae bacterium]
MGGVAKVKNLGLVDVNIAGSGGQIGALAGHNSYGTVTQCYSTGVLSGDHSVGGLVGANPGNVTQCYSAGAVSGNSSVGGLVGHNYGAVTNCYSTNAVSGHWFVGGLVGYNDGTVTNCYSTGAVSGGYYVGGLVGYSWQGIVIACFWDVQSAGQTESAGGTGLTTAEMHTAGAFVGWWYGSIWTIDEGKDYPRLRWEHATGEPITRAYFYGGGSGTRADPYLIYTPEQLNRIGMIVCDWDKYFKLMADIDLSGFDGKNRRPTFNVIGCATSFSGVFDGNGHVISHLAINGGGHRGLFGYLDYRGEVKNLGTVDVWITGTYYYSGGLVASNAGTVTGCYSTGLVSGGEGPIGGLVGQNGGHVTNCHSTIRANGASEVGGLVGVNWGTVTQCYSSGAVDGNDYVGGLVGGNYSDRECTGWFGIVRECYSTGAVTGTGDYVGGLIGGNDGGVSQCYSTAAADGNDCVGGLVGRNGGTVTQCYSTGTVSSASTVGGLLARNEGDVTGCFWDMQTSGQTASAAGEGKTTLEMQGATTFLEAGWDLKDETTNGAEETWWILDGRYYPLLWDLTPPHVWSPYPKDGAIDIDRGAILTWVPGRSAAEYDVYLGEDADAVGGATVENIGIYRGRQGRIIYDPAGLEWGKTYYWRIDEVNVADPNSPWKGSVWRFTTADFIVVTIVDDFESYADDMGAGGAIFQTWRDGYGCVGCEPEIQGNGTGSCVGNMSEPYAEQGTVHGGNQSMPMDYNNSREPGYSEAERTWETPQDWTIGGADTLTLYFRGKADNGREPLYVVIEDSAGRIAVVVHPDADAVLATEWQKWHIALGEVRAAGVDMAAVKKMVIGVGDRKNPQPGGTGRIYIDDIRLTKRMP